VSEKCPNKKRKIKKIKSLTSRSISNYLSNFRKRLAQLRAFEIFVTGHSRPVNMAEFDTSYTTSYQSDIIIAALLAALCHFRTIWHWRISWPWNLR